MKVFKLAAIVVALSFSAAGQAKEINEAFGTMTGETTVRVKAVVPSIFKLVTVEGHDLSIHAPFVLGNHEEHGGVTTGDLKFMVKSNQANQGIMITLKEDVELAATGINAADNKIPLHFKLGAQNLVAGTPVTLSKDDLFTESGSKELTLVASAKDIAASRWRDAGEYEGDATLVVSLATAAP